MPAFYIFLSGRLFNFMSVLVKEKLFTHVSQAFTLKLKKKRAETEVLMHRKVYLNDCLCLQVVFT